MPGAPPSSTVTFEFSQSVISGGIKYYDWSNPANWSDGTVPNSGISDIIIPPGGGNGYSLDDIATLTVRTLSIEPGARGVRVGANAILTVTGAVGNGTMQMGAGSQLLELRSGYSYVELLGNNSLVLQGGQPHGYIEFDPTGVAAGTLFLESPAAPVGGKPGTDTQTISGFQGLDQIFLKQPVAPAGALSVTFTPSGGGNGNLLIDEGGNPLYNFTNFHGNAAIDYQVAATTVVDPSTGATVNAIDVFVCFAAGTRIATPGGERAVETLSAGDIVFALEEGAPRPRRVRWVGYRRLDLTAHPRPERAAPIRFRAGSLDETVPHRDLLVSPDHAMLIDGALIPAKLLVNNMSIVRESGLPSVTYYHIELDSHAILLAEGAASESYLDTGNRGFFANGGEPLVLHPDLCAPVVRNAEQVEPIWRRLAARAHAHGFSVHAHPTTADAGLFLLADGMAVSAAGDHDDRRCFFLPRGAKSVRLVSRAFVPSDGARWVDDFRRLGVAVRSITLLSGESTRVVGLDDPALTDGWHAAEHADGMAWRWTDGDATLTLDAPAGSVIDVELQATGCYPVTAEERLAA